MSSRFERGATSHGTRRIRKRMKLPARAVRRLVESARADGIHEADMPGWLQIAVAHKRTLHPIGAAYVYFRGYLFVFQEGVGDLITTYAMAMDEPELEAPDWDEIRAKRTFH